MRLLAALLFLLASAAHADPAVVLFLGDSLTAGRGLDPSKAFPALLEARWRAEGRDVKVVNAGVSGDTSAGGKRRLRWALRAKPDLVVVALGANDGLRGAPPSATRENLGAILASLREAGVRAALLGMRLPTNYGAEHRGAFEAVFPALAEEHGVPLLPFLLEGVAMKPELNLGDGVHPNAAGQAVMAETVAGFLAPLLDELAPAEP